MNGVLSNITFDRTADSPSLAEAGQRDRYADRTDDTGYLRVCLNVVDAQLVPDAKD